MGVNSLWVVWLSLLGIVGGTTDLDDPGVIALSADTLQICTGTVIGKRTVLTAGHCIAPLGDVPYFANFGPDSAKPTRRIKLLRQRAHPKFAGEGKPFDLGAVELSADAPAGAVTWKRTALATDVVGKSVRHVGYGISDEAAGEGRGTKRMSTQPVVKLDADFIYSSADGGQTCLGDSGGPAFMAGEVVAVVSDGPSCHEDGWDQLLDPAFIDTALKDFEPAAPAPVKTGCTVAPGGLCALLLLYGMRARKSAMRG